MGRQAAACVVFLSCVQFAAPFADSIVIGGVKHEGVTVYESERQYYVRLPSGKTLSVAKSEVSPSDVHIEPKIDPNTDKPTDRPVRLSSPSKNLGKSQSTLHHPLSPTASAWRVEYYREFDSKAFRSFAPANAIITRDSVDLDLLSAAVFYASNVARAGNNRPPLIDSPALRECALGHSRDMSTGGFFSHENPKDPAKRTMEKRFAACGIPVSYCGENIAVSGAKGLSYIAYADKVVQTWMDSAGHRANLLNPKYRYIGCGVYPCRCPKFHLHATQNFADLVN